VDEVYAGPDPLAAAIDSLRTWLAVVGVLATLAAGLAVYSLLTDDEGDGQGASRGRVAALTDRVDALEERAGDGGSKSELAQLDKRIEDRATSGELDSLSDRVDAVEKQAGDAADAPAADPQTTKAVADLRADLQEIGQRVEDLEAKKAP